MALNDFFLEKGLTFAGASSFLDTSVRIRRLLLQASHMIERVKLRPGRRGPGSKPARARSIAEFSAGFKQVSSDRGYARLARKVSKERRLESDRESGTLAERRRELQLAVEAVSSKTATDDRRKLVRKASDAEFFARMYEGQQSSYERIVTVGFVWPGGMVAGKYYRKPFIEKGLRSWRHPFFQRVAASTARAWTGRLRSGPAKDRCIRQFQKLHGLDNVYIFFSDACRDMFRIDLDRTFDSEYQLRSWIADVVRTNDLACAPHIASWIPDDRHPGKIISPHLFVLLPEGHAVWPSSPPEHHRLLGEVIAAMTRAFEGDPGGLAHPFSGKNPLSPVCEAIIVQDTHMPTLSEYAESMDLSYDPELMLRKLMTDRLEAVGFDRADSNTWFSSVSALANAGAKTLFKGGFDISDRNLFQVKITDLITATVFDEVQPSPSQRDTVAKLIESCTRWTAAKFDPAKMDTLHRDRGAAAHLMTDTDDSKTKMTKGQTYSAAVKVRRTRSQLTQAMMKMIRAGHEPTIADVARATSKAYNTVKTHFFTCYVTAIASVAVQDLVKGVNSTSGQPRPSNRILLTANRRSEFPDSWAPKSGDPVFDHHFRQQELRLARLHRRRPGERSSSELNRVPGRNTLNFMSAGLVTVFKPSIRGLRSGRHPDQTSIAIQVKHWSQD
ncbi:MAG: hypothetical protein J0G33_03790 [Afipia felis]|nr:hypothetical protein [Afipia felis]